MAWAKLVGQIAKAYGSKPTCELLTKMQSPKKRKSTPTAAAWHCRHKRPSVRAAKSHSCQKWVIPLVNG